MAEVVIAVSNQPLTGDPYKDRHRWERGCVLEIMPDGHQWSERELNNPKWRIIKLPGIAPRLLSQFIASDLGYGSEEAEKLNPVLRRWAAKIDFDAVEALLQSPATRDDIEKRPVKALSLVLNLRRQCAELQTPAADRADRGLVRVIG